MIVAKRYISWPNGPMDQIVAGWFAANGIDSKLVRSYTIERDGVGSSWIRIEMYFDQQQWAEVTEFPPKEE